MEGFARLGFPHCIGAVDGTHITIKPPRAYAAEYINKKHYISILLQGTTDHTGRFIAVELGFGGRGHDSLVFKQSALCAAMDAGLFVPGNPTITISGVSVPPLVLADATYPIREWLMKPYGCHIDERKMHFDQRLARARNVVECAFRRLKQRWRCLSSTLCVSESNAAAVVRACVALHNICEQEGCTSILEQVARPAAVLPHHVDMEVLDRRQHLLGNAVRDAISTFFYHGD